MLDLQHLKHHLSTGMLIHGGSTIYQHVEEVVAEIESLRAENERVWADYLKLHEAIRKHRDEHLGACCTEDDKLLWSHINVKH